MRYDGAVRSPAGGTTPMAERFFNTSGPVVPEDHYSIPPLGRLDLDEIGRGRCAAANEAGTVGGRDQMRTYDGTAWAWRGINPDGTPDEGTLARLNSAIVEAVRPVRIILFGSAARGEMRAKSDLDVLVVVPDGQNRRRIARTVYRARPRGTRPLDLVVATESDVERHRNARWYVIASALREGRVLYERRAQA